MHKKMIFFDIDGTLLDEKTMTVPQSTIEAIKMAQKNGHLCFINTGRPISTIDSIITDIPFDGYICGCGTYIQYHQQALFHNQLDIEFRKKVIHGIKQYQVDAMLEGKDGVTRFKTSFYSKNQKKISGHRFFCPHFLIS